MELRHLRYFVAVAETHNFTEAAARHYVAQSALSQQISRLEADLGARLFHRNSRAVSLTAAGELLLPIAKRIMSDVEIARMEIDALNGLERGKLRIGLIHSAAIPVDVIAILAEFHRHHPGIRFEIVDATSINMITAVSKEDIDLAVVALDQDELPRHLAYIPLSVAPLLAVVSTSNPFAQRDRITLTELATQEPFIHFKPGTGLRVHVDAAFERAQAAPFSSFEIGQITDILRMAARGIGVTVLPPMPEVLARQVDQTPFAVIPLADDLARHPVGAIYSPDRLSSAASAFADMLRTYSRPRSAPAAD